MPVWATGDPVSEAKVKTKVKWKKKNQPKALNQALKLGTRANVQNLRG